ncbi:hypothetical protein HD806DRAFT_519717 [Xylariaceae sp. AK1471]|nr:hypothetical protein HD806DRAFT_519717 [Xylariaceae sp. AK1471]
MDLLGSVFNHLVLPPDVPGAQDTDVDAISRAIVQRMIHATDTALGLTTDAPWREAYQHLQASFRACLELNRGRLERTSLLKHFKKLTSGRILILYANEQNAGLLVRRETQDDMECIVFESFEASAIASNVLAAGHAMQWDFPGRAVKIAADDFADDSFQESLATFLEQASMESLYNLQASTQKAGVSVGEIRDTTDPALVSQMLMSLLEAVGSHYPAPVLRKQVRDDVNLGGANIPWRRLPFWLVLRVAAQRQLCFALGHERGQVGYKCLLAIVLAELLDESVDKILSPHKVIQLRTKLARQNANAKVEAAWDSFKRHTTRCILPLPTRAPVDSLKLTLPNSGKYLDRILSNKSLQHPTLTPVTLPSPLDQSIQRSQQFMDDAFHLAALENTIEQEFSLLQSTTLDNDDHCLKLESRINGVFEAVGSTYESNPTQNSAMILSIFTLWVGLDRAVIATHRLLSEYAPVFQPELLDVLQLPTKSAMERLQKIQEYLAGRHAKSIYGSILETPGQESIALRYIARSESLRSLERRIQANSDDAGQQKHTEHTKTCDEYDEHTENIARHQCCCTWEDDRRIVHGCTKCWHWRVRNRMSIAVHEAFLPEENPARGTTVFELAIPGWLSAYRDATWQILSKLAHPFQPRGARPEIRLQDCGPLKSFMKAKVKRLSLASKIKCFEQTHYKFSQGKVPLARVVLPFAARFQLYDHKLRIWVEDLTNPLTLEHLCGIQVPRGLLSILPKTLHPPTIIDGPTSYEIQANQAAAPKDMSVQAFSAYQKLLAGKRRRWLNILVEMSSSNLNLSDETGPRLPGEPLRAVHEVFKYSNLLESIRTNWREYNIMELVSVGKTVLTAARKCLLEWIGLVREKIQDTKDSTEAQSYARYGLYAALLCRETFAICVDSENHLASIAMQENLLLDISQLSDKLRSILLRDAKMAYHLQGLITSTMKLYRSTVGAGITRGWSSSSLSFEKACSSWSFLDKPNDRWIAATTTDQCPDRLHFNYIEGHLLVNGRPRSKLPLDIADDDVVNQSGMSHQLAQLIGGHTVHFGLRNRRASNVQETWEFVSQWVFSRPGSFDLPAELRLEIRRALPNTPSFWVTRPRDWIVDVPRRRASRGIEIFTQIADMFCDFEQPDKLTVYQPRNLAGRLTVELKHLDLHFAQLHAEIDPNQNAGTWYDRSIIVPLGGATIRRNGRDYARFKIDSRKGSSEAFAILLSGTAQPWTGISSSGHAVFEDFNKLVPRRQYYPLNVKRLQKVCDGYRPVIEAIKESHLCHRGRAQRYIYDPLLGFEASYRFTQVVYFPRDRRTGSEAAKVYRISRVILSRCLQFHMTSDNSINENWASKSSLLFRLGLLAFSKSANMNAIHALAAFGLHDLFRNFQSCEQPSIELLESLIAPTYPKFKPMRTAAEHGRLCQNEGKRLARHNVTMEMLEPPPGGSPRVSSNVSIDIKSAHANMELSNYITRVDEVLMSLSRVPKAPNFMITQRYQSEKSIIQDWTAKSGPALEVTAPSNLFCIAGAIGGQNQVLDSIPKPPRSDNNLRKHYAGDLRKSLIALQTASQQTQLATDAHIPSVESHVKGTWRAIATAFTAGNNRDRSTATYNFGSAMKDAIRLDPQALYDELCTRGHENWSPLEVPDWLLLEIDGDILIRTEQVAVARAIADPTSGNRVLQMNCGKGKTSCIIPMVEAVLADGEHLSRVVVPRALLMQTAQTMQSKLGGLVGRQIFYTPFSRRTSTKGKTLDLYADLHRECRRLHGIMLTSHETLLSYKLCGWQKLVDSEMSTANEMIRFQEWLDAHCRDVLDECDYTLSVKTQLNYPSGPVMPVDFYPYRWQIAQELLGLVASHLRNLQCQHPRGIQVTFRQRGGSFPAISFLRTDTENALHDLIVDDICSGRMTFLRPSHSRFQQTRSAIREVLYGTNVSEKSLDHAARLFSNTSIVGDVLLLIRGLLLHRILVLCLGKRWNVQYGLHPARDPVAVPYEAKGKPSEQAEYGHPDVAILFTCLSFYYAGLTIEQLVQGVENILHHSDDPAAQYEWWTSSCTHLPKSLRHWNVINTDDKGQMEQLWGHLRWNRIVINHYLNHFVFPLHARQFEVKLQACSWDIPIFSENDTQLTRTTGFSGTNDNRIMLPLTICQRDLPELQHTSAEVLSYFLQQRNRNFYLTADEKGKRLMEKDLLINLKAKEIRLLIDVGAYISEMENKELAKTWLEVDSDAKAAVYFGNDNRAWVHYKSNAKDDVPLLATPFADNLSGCVVFLDEAHTRGVDLKLPVHARGAVTLALKLTKDYTVQAAMRLRQLRTTQSICFYGPPEVDQSIRHYCNLSQAQNIDSFHVVSWLLEQTCRSVEDLQGLHVAQGIDFCRRIDTVWHCKNFTTNNTERQKLLRVLKQPERQTLKHLYGPVSGKSSMNSEGRFVSSQLNSFMDKLVSYSKDQKDRFQAGALEEVEQEREVEVQVEQVRQVEKPKRFEALKFPGLHEDILHFARTGRLEALKPAKTRKSGFEHAFAFVGRMSIAKRFSVHETSSKLFVSREFGNTVKTSNGSKEDDNFLRPVEWIVWSPTAETALVIIPEEAELFIELLRGREHESLVHLITYAAPVTRAMIHFNTLEFYTFPNLLKGHKIPEIIRIELGILAGRLYVDHTEWKSVAEYVAELFVSDKIADDPAAFILEWLTIRRKAVDVLHTPMGYICTGREMEDVGSSEEVLDKES